MTHTPEISAYEMAQLRLAAATLLKGWGYVREDGKWTPWNATELHGMAAEWAIWALDWNKTCSFCGKNNREVKKLIAGSRGFICDECIPLCSEILAKEMAKNVANTEASR